MLFVVLGMHKSGTTLTSQILHHSGINMDDQLDPNIDYDRGNKYERQTVLHLNMEILGTDSYSSIDLKANDGITISSELRTRMQAVVDECRRRYPDWGFKDPRTTLTYPYWEELLPEHKLIAIFREPAAIWPRYRYHGIHHSIGNIRRAVMFLDRWFDHNHRILDIMARSNRERLILFYDALMTSDEEFRRLERFVGRPLVDQRRPELFRHRSGFSPYMKLAEARLRGTYGTIEETMRRLHALREEQIRDSDDAPVEASIS